MLQVYILTLLIITKQLWSFFLLDNLDFFRWQLNQTSHCILQMLPSTKPDFCSSGTAWIRSVYLRSCSRSSCSCTPTRRRRRSFRPPSTSPLGCGRRSGTWWPRLCSDTSGPSPTLMGKSRKKTFFLFQSGPFKWKDFAVLKVLWVFHKR